MAIRGKSSVLDKLDGFLVEHEKLDHEKFFEMFVRIHLTNMAGYVVQALHENPHENIPVKVWGRERFISDNSNLIKYGHDKSLGSQYYLRTGADQNVIYTIRVMGLRPGERIIVQIDTSSIEGRLTGKHAIFLGSVRVKDRNIFLQDGLDFTLLQHNEMIGCFFLYFIRKNLIGG